MPKKLTKEIFIERAKLLYGDKYDYSKVNYINSITKVCIICPIHGEFWMTPNNHINQKQQCPKCQHQSWTNTKEDFIQKIENKFPNTYEFNKLKYVNNKTPVCVTCKIHGDFYVRPDNFIHSIIGCPKCAIEQTHNKQRKSLKDFIDKANIIHNFKYDYSKVDYTNVDQKVCIICPKHGEFWQTPDNHLHNHGCPYCNESKLEKTIAIKLSELNIRYERQKTFDWLVYKGNLFLDFFLPDYNIAIECQGRQHYESCDYFGGEESFKILLQRDQCKQKLCNKHDIKLLYYGIFETKDIFQSVELLIKEILNNE